jgi:glyceraldehyde 3-phosphate dehydrogenase
VLRAREICPEKVRKVVITHSPDSGVDATLIQGANEGSYVKDHHHVISASICDAVAVAPILNELDKFCGLNNCFFTTLHPCLSYQNVLDGTLRSVSSPGNYWRDYGLGRSMIGNLIPKETTAAKATLKVLPQLRGRVAAMSYRIPTQIVTSSDITAVTNRKVVATEINELFSGLAVTNPQVFGVSNDHMVSLDYLGTEKSVFIDTRWTMVAGDNMLKLVVWYDNEHGYSSKVLDLVEMVISGALPHE